MIRRLVAKEILEHRWVAVGVALLAVAQYLAFLQFSLRHEPPTALVAATNFVWGTSPMIAAYAARRLFVLEQEQRTIQLLRSLPVSPAAVTATKLALGLVYTLAVSLTVVWVSAWMLRNQEILTVEWVQRLSVQVGAYVFAWYALACFHAHLGGYRFAVWLVFLVALMSLDDVFDNPSRHLFWTAALADDIETTRYETPWDAVALSLGWGLAASAATMLVAVRRGGAWVDAWFAPMSGRRRAQVTGVAIVALLGLEVASNAGRRQPGLHPPAVGERWLETGDRSLGPLAEATRETVSDLNARYGIAPPPRVLLRVRRDDRREEVLTRILKSGDLVMGVRPDALPAERRRGVLSDVLTGVTAGHWERVPTTGAWALGFAPFVLGGDELAPTGARLGGLSSTALDDFESIRERFGRRGVEAAGWLAWQALADSGGTAAVAALVDVLFGDRRSNTSAGLVVARWTGGDSVLRAAGVERAAFDEAWSRGLADLQARVDVPSVPLLPAIVLERPRTELPRLTWSPLAIDLASRRVEVWWSVAGNLEPYAVPAEEIRAAPVDPEMFGQIIVFDPRRRIIATWVVDGEVQGWREVRRS